MRLGLAHSIMETMDTALRFGWNLIRQKNEEEEGRDSFPSIIQNKEEEDEVNAHQ
jgi:hypothetical protein